MTEDDRHGIDATGAISRFMQAKFKRGDQRAGSDIDPAALLREFKKSNADPLLFQQRVKPDEAATDEELEEVERRMAQDREIIEGLAAGTITIEELEAALESGDDEG
jgi:predicted nucleotidyltransferase